MTKRIRPAKLWYIWAAVSAVFILAGVVLFALLGFNASLEVPSYSTFEISYEVRVGVAKQEKVVQELCESALKANQISWSKVKSGSESDKEVGGNYFDETGVTRIVYTLKGNVTAEQRAAAKTAAQENIRVGVSNGFLASGLDKSISVGFHDYKNQTIGGAGWRAAVGIAVGAVVVLIYMGVRFGVGAALTGLTVFVHDVVLSLSLFAIFRIPVFLIGPLLVGAVAGIMSLLLWLIQCMKMRENFKDESYAEYTALEAVEHSAKSAFKTVVVTAGAFAGVICVLGVVGAIASVGLCAMVLPLLISVAVPVYGSLIVGPSVHVHVKKAFDKRKAKKQASGYKGRKWGKKEKAEQTEEPQD